MDQPLLSAFAKFDVDGDGMISQEEIKFALKKYWSIDLTDEETAAIMAIYTYDSDGTGLDFDDFSYYMKNLPLLDPKAISRFWVTQLYANVSYQQLHPPSESPSGAAHRERSVEMYDQDGGRKGATVATVSMMEERLEWLKRKISIAAQDDEPPPQDDVQDGTNRRPGGGRTGDGRTAAVDIPGRWRGDGGGSASSSRRSSQERAAACADIDQGSNSCTSSSAFPSLSSSPSSRRSSSSRSFPSLGGLPSEGDEDMRGSTGSSSSVSSSSSRSPSFSAHCAAARRRKSLRFDLAEELEEATWTADDISSRVNSIIRGGGGDDSDGGGGGGGGVDSGGDTQLLDAYFTAIADPPADDDDGRRKSEGGTSGTRAPFPFSPTSRTSETCASPSLATQPDANLPCTRLHNLQKSDLVEPESPAPRITRARTLTEDAGHVDDHRFPSSSSTESLPSLHSSDEEDRGRSSTGSFTFSSARQQAKAVYISQTSSSSSSHFPPLSSP